MKHGPKTFDQWKKLGRPVKKGEKATGRNRIGLCTFTVEQVMTKEEMIEQDEMMSEMEGCRHEIY